MEKGIDYPGITICYFCHDGQGNFLMNFRSKNCRDEHERWDTGAGGLEFNDGIEQTLKKEIKEEYCTDVIDYEFLGFRELHRQHNDKQTHWITLDFKVLVNKDKVQNGEPHKFEKIGWFTLNNLPQPVHSQFPEFIKKYRGNLEENLTALV